MNESVSVVVPTYRSNDTTPLLVERITSALSERGCEFEILLVEDASPDNGSTWFAILQLAKSNRHVRGFRLLRNRGQHNALLLGIREAKCETIVTIDDDLQNPPEEIGLLLDQLQKEDADVVYGVPREKQHGFVQNLGSRAVRYGLALILGAEPARHVTSFRAFKTVLRDSFAWHQSPRVSIDALLGWGASRYSKVVVEHHPRQHGESGYSFRKLVGHALTMVTSYSTMPLRVATLTGFALVLVGAVVSTYVIVGRLLGYVTEPGFTSLISLFSIIGGAQLLALGIIGEYLATIFMRSLGMPAYTLAEKTDSDPENAV